MRRPPRVLCERGPGGERPFAAPELGVQGRGDGRGAHGGEEAHGGRRAEGVLRKESALYCKSLCKRSTSTFVPIVCRSLSPNRSAGALHRFGRVRANSARC